MIGSLKSFLYLIDLIGKSPQLLIFNNYRNISILSSLISLIIILISIAFTIYSILEYLKYINPNITYSKDNDGETNRNIYKRDFLFMFQLIDTTSYETLDNSIGYYVAEYIIVYNNGTNIYTPLDIETCEIGKNMDKKYQNFVNDKSTYGRKIEEFKCISSKFENISLFYDPNVGFSAINLYIIFQNNTNYTPEKIQSLLIAENNIHIKKNTNKIMLIKNKRNEPSIGKVKSEIFDNSNNLDNTTKSNKIKLSENNNKISENNHIDKKNDKNKILKEINFYHILKSFLCFKDKKSQFINFCYNIITKDMSIERILERFYNLEKINYYLSNEEKRKLKHIKNKKFLEIDKKIDEINDEIAKEEKSENKNLIPNLNFNKEIK